MNNRINFLPPWVETNLQPAFYDLESGTCLQQTARMYAKVNQLVRIANEQYAKIEEFVAKFVELKDYVDEYFDNLDVQDEINNKLNNMAEDGSLSMLLAQVLQPTIDELNENFDELEEEVQSELADFGATLDRAVGQTPIVVSSTSAMTDTDKVYVNTTDGKWYYWNGSAWTIGGTYQSTGLSANSVEKYMTTFRKQSGDNMFDWTSASVLDLNLNSNPIQANSTTKVVVVPVEHYKSYTVSKVQSARFAIALYNSYPAVGVSRVGNKVEDNDATELSITVGNNASYLAIYFYLRDVDTLTQETVLRSITVRESNYEEYPSGLDYYALSIGNKDLNDGAVSEEKTSFSKTSNNIFDIKNPNIVNGYFNRSTTTITSNSLMRVVYVECEANTTYTVVKPSLSERFSVGYTTTEPAIGVSVSDVQTSDDLHPITITTGATATHIAAFVCKTDIMSLEEALEGFMVYKGTAPNHFVPHKIISVDTDNLANGCVTSEKLAPEVTGNNYLSSRSNVYGITFDITESPATVTRIANAVGLHNDYVIGNDYQLNGGVNDFDNIYPWSDIRLCNVKFDENGKKTIVYSDDNSFTRDGTNGEVMVEIPKFYSFRQRIGNQETWAISGEKKAGFECEPLFMVNGKETDFAYIGAYNGTSQQTVSCSGYLPLVDTSLPQFITNYTAKHMQSYDITAFFAIQKLMMIEFADRNLQNYFGGIVNQTYMRAGQNLNTDGIIRAIPDANEVQISVNSNERPKYFFVGQYVKFGKVNSANNITENVRKIVSMTYDEDTGYYDIVYDGTDLSDTIAVDTWGVYGMPQENGLTDDLIYHTGRTNFATIGTDTTLKNLNNPFKYRHIENVYGNVWERIAGIRTKNLRHYINTEPNAYTLTSDWKDAGFNVPLQTTYGHASTAWIVEESYDRNQPLIALPSKIGASNGGGNNKFFSDSFYSNNATNVEYESVVGGAWDHYIFSGAFTIRSYELPSSQSWLYGNRPIIRG